MMSPRKIRTLRWLGLILLLVSGLAQVGPVQAATYTFSNSSYPACSDGNWSQSGSTRTCSGSFTLNSGDTISPTSSLTIMAYDGMTFNGSNTVGSSSKPVALQTRSGDVSVSSNSTIYGSVSASSYGDISLSGTTVTGAVSTSGSITLTNSTVGGAVTTIGSISLSGSNIAGNVSGRNGVTSTNGTVFGGSITVTNGSISLSAGSVAGNVSGANGVSARNGTVFAGAISASNGPVSLSGGSVAGNVSSDCCTIATNGTNLSAGATSNHGSVQISGGVIAGAIWSGGGDGISISNATMTSGSIGTSRVPITISNSLIGSASSSVNVTSDNTVTISNNAIVYGNVTAGSWASALSIDNTSTAYGVCTSNSDSNINPPNYPRCAVAVSGPNHVELAQTGTAVTCMPQPVTVYGCTTSATCSNVAANQYTSGSFTIAPTPISGATWCSNSTCTSTLSSPATVTSGTVIYLKDTSARTDTMAGTSNATNTTLQCYNTSSGSASCGVTFASSIFLVSVPNNASCSSQTLTIQAVKSSTNPAQCTPMFASTTRAETIQFGYSNPATGTLAPAVGGTTISTAGTSVNLTFNASGIASPTFSYADVGRLLLTVSDSALGMTGSTTTIVAPASLTISAIPSAPLTAGQAFNTTVTAMNACSTPAATLNFGKETSPATATLSKVPTSFQMRLVLAWPELKPDSV